MKYSGPHASSQFVLKLFKWFCKPEIHIDIEGDLLELFKERSQEHSLQKARWLMFLDVLLLFRPGIIRPFLPSFIQPAMLKFDLLITYRSFLRNKTTFLINLIGLSTGLACALMIFLWVQDEMSIDKFHQKDDQLYQVVQNIPNSEGILTTEHTQGLLAETIEKELPEVEHAVSVVPPAWFEGDKGIISIDETFLKASPKFIGDAYFNVFSCEILEGSTEALFTEKHALAISTSLAQRLFGRTDNLVGELIEWDYWKYSGTYEIAAVFLPPPSNATDQFELLFDYDLFLQARPWTRGWGNSDPHTYMILAKGTDLKQFDQKLNQILKANHPETTHQLISRKYSDSYLYNRFENGQQVGGRIEYVRLFSLIAFFLLIMACINYVNLSTAKAAVRTKEIGVKKTFGVRRWALIKQHLLESFIMISLSTIIAFLLVRLGLADFNSLANKELTLEVSPTLILGSLTIVLLTSLLAGSYPAMYLSGLKPVNILKGNLSSRIGSTNTKEAFARRGLVIFQFVISIVLIVGVLIVNQQISFLQEKNLGYDKQNLLHFGLAEDFLEEAEEGERSPTTTTFINEIVSLPAVRSVGNFCHDLYGDHGGMSGLDWKEGDEDEKMRFRNLEVGYNFLKTTGIQLKEGRSFSTDFGNDESRILINEKAAEIMGFQNPVGKTVTFWGEEREIIGVAKNFHFESLHESIHPCVIQLYSDCSQLMVKYKAGAEQEVIARLAEVHQEFFPGLPFEYEFTDEDEYRLYASEHQVSRLSRYFATIGIIISCLGLFGLATFTAERRKKELGIRKILGASAMNLVRLLSRDFSLMVGIAIMLGIPIGYVLSQLWLENFAYKMELSLWYFVLSALITLLIAWITVGLQTYKAANLNPVDSLRNE
ncbi:MAG: FtsX-like permease family protein [Bacteroidota bacterium]